jgi:hypothetical protein
MNGVKLELEPMANKIWIQQDLQAIGLHDGCCLWRCHRGVVYQRQSTQSPLGSDNNSLLIYGWLLKRQWSQCHSCSICHTYSCDSFSGKVEPGILGYCTTMEQWHGMAWHRRLAATIQERF